MRTFSYIALALIVTWLVFMPYSLAEEVDDFMTVVVTGVGKDSDAALKNALRAAVEQAVGVLVDTETFVENDNLISDKILSLSRGFVSAYRPIGEPQTGEDGLVTVRIKAEVERTALRNRLKDAKVIVEDVDGGSLYAETVTKINAMKSEQEMWQIVPAFLKESKFPESLYGAKIIGKPTYDPEKRKTTVKFEVFVDNGRYNAFVDSLRGVLNTLKAPSKQATVLFDMNKDQKGVITLSRSQGDLSDLIPTDKAGLILSVNPNIPIVNFKWEGFVIDEDTLNEIQPLLGLKECYVRMECLDATGGILHHEDLLVPKLTAIHPAQDKRKPKILICPTFLIGNVIGNVAYTLCDRFPGRHDMCLQGDGRSIEMTVELDFTPEQLRNMAKVQFSFHEK